MSAFHPARSKTISEEVKRDIRILTCPAGKVAVGGGHSASDQAADIFSSGPFANGGGWTIFAKNDNLIAGSLDVTGFDVCIDGPPNYMMRQASDNPCTQERKEVPIKCEDAGFKLLGGGATAAESYACTTSSAPAANGAAWRANNRSTWVRPSNTSVATMAICASIFQIPQDIVAIAGQPSALGPSTTQSLDVMCPAGKRP